MIRKFLVLLEKYHFFFFAAILLFATATRLWRLEFPTEYYFDEVYHAVTAKLMAQNDPRAYEWWNAAPEPNTAVDWLHPPLAKLLQAASIFLFGSSSWSWRFSSAVFGVGVIALVYLLARQLKLSRNTALLAAFLAACDGLLLTMSRITMNDIHVTFWYLLSLVLYLNWKENTARALRKTLFVGLAVGAAVASKWSGVFLLGVIATDQAWEWLTSSEETSHFLRRSLQLLFALLACVPAVYLLSYSQMWLQGKDWQHFSDLHQQIWWYQNNLEATHPYQSTPTDWIFALRPVYAYTSSVGADQILNIYLQANPLLFWAGALSIFWSLGFLIASGLNWVRSSKKLWTVSEKRLLSTRKRALESWNSLSSLTLEAPRQTLLFLLLAYFSTWAFWIFSPRIMFFYHYTPAVPFLCLILALQLQTLRGRWRWIKVIVILSILLNFLLFYPNLTGIAVPHDPWYELFFWVKSWR